MKHTWLVGAVVTVLFAAGAAAHSPLDTEGTTQQAQGGEVLGTVTIPRAVLADGKPLPAGRYTLRLTPQTAEPTVAGQVPDLNRWVEFVQNGQVRGREIVSIIPAAEVKDTMTGPDLTERAPTAGRQRVEMLRGGDYLRVWITRNGTNYLLHLPPQSATRS